MALEASKFSVSETRLSVLKRCTVCQPATKINQFYSLDLQFPPNVFGGCWDGMKNNNTLMLTRDYRLLASNRRNPTLPKLNLPLVQTILLRCGLVDWPSNQKEQFLTIIRCQKDEKLFSLGNWTWWQKQLRVFMICNLFLFYSNLWKFPS